MRIGGSGLLDFLAAPAKGVSQGWDKSGWATLFAPTTKSEPSSGKSSGGLWLLAAAALLMLGAEE